MQAGIIPNHREEAKEFWEAIDRGELCVQRCTSCGEYIFYPRQYCPNDMGELRFEKVSGKGRILSYTVVEKHAQPQFKDHLPIIIAVIQLDEGPMMLSRLLNVTPNEVEFNQKVQVLIDKISEENSLPFFIPAK